MIATMNALTKAEHHAVIRARTVLAQSLQEEVAPEQLLPLMITVAVVSFADVVKAAGRETPAIISFINARIGDTGLQLVATGGRKVMS